MAKNDEKLCSNCLKPIFWLISATRKSDGKHGFSSFFAIFDDFFNVEKVQWNFEKSSNMAKNDKKVYSTCLSNPFFSADSSYVPENRISGTVPIIITH